MEKSEGAILNIEGGGPSWPERLTNIDCAPEELWLRGENRLVSKSRAIAIVGSRSPTPYGLEQARLFAGTFAAAGVVVISGLARGVDAAAHTAALDAGGETIAVLGSSVDRPWPAGDVATRVLKEGLLLSEHPLGTDPRPHHFPLRNRLISGLSDAVVVIEAAARSGSLITAHWAADQGRDVFALPGRVDQPMSRGTHKLIREGASLVEDPRELLVELYGASDVARRSEEPPEDEDIIMARLSEEDLTVDELVAATGIEVRALLNRLVEGELSGLIARAPGGLYRRVRPRT